MGNPGRPPEVRIELGDDERRKLREFARHAVGRVSERAHFVLLSDRGKTVTEIAEWMCYSPPTVYFWLERYRRSGIAGLDDEPRSGRPMVDRLLFLVVACQLSMAPVCYGYLAGCWTLHLLALHLANRFKTRASLSTLRRAIAQADFTWSRPKLVLPKRRDPEEAPKLAYLEQALADPVATVLAEDECDMQLLPTVRGTWHPRGRQPEIPTPGQNQKRGVFGMVNLRTGAWLYHLTERKRSVEFIGFLGEILATYLVGAVYLLVDNASIHTSKMTLKWVAEHPRLHLVPLPTYAGHDYNPVEKVWWRLKAVVSANRCFKVLAELDQAIHRHFRGTTPAAMLALINSPVVRRAQAALMPAEEAQLPTAA